jgi:predicted DsbA family dithiol-disulfide isomerase
MTGNAVIEIISDVVCPWCYIGKRRIEKALKLLRRANVQLRWRAFELNPGTPKAGVAWDTFMVRKFGSLAYARQLEAHVAAVGAEEGIDLRFDRIKRLPNTFDAHRLIWLAGREGKQADVVERLYHAYFIEGQDIGTQETLIQIAADAGLDSTDIGAFLNGDSGVAEVIAERNESLARGVDGVPAFFMNGVQIASGAQSPEILAAVTHSVLEQCEGGTCA